MTRFSVQDPFAEVFPELLRGFLTPVRNGGSAPVETRIDVRETPKDYIIHADLPGVARENLSVELDGNRVSITAEIKRQTERREGEQLLRSERYSGSIARSFALACEIDEAHSEARLENGVLTLTLPKKAGSGVRRLAIH